MKIGVFCSANSNIDPDFFSLTRELGTWIGQKGHTLVFGGCNMGLMECIAQSVHEAGGSTIGVVPQVIEKGGKVSDFVDVNIACDNLSDRKDLMLLQSDVLIALPGGIGTLDEIFSVAAAHTIGYHNKRVIIYNMKGFWDSTIRMLDDLQSQGLIRGSWRNYIQIANSMEQIQLLIS
ncbi:MAG: TIGR00730 family Rossman fold protein [Bacteroidaceae bacterium]|nr:TIGR00730 family Rossman fold protein [Bacteroidaceae bacterium]MBR6047295.1 TIGR00730 family Rossman fold protein [Bacteroidaceae bacterium]